MVLVIHLFSILSGFVVAFSICFSSSHREIYRERTFIEGLRPPVPPQIHCPAENARRPTRIRVLHELRHQRRPDATRDVAPQQRQPQHQH